MVRANAAFIEDRQRQESKQPTYFTVRSFPGESAEETATEERIAGAVADQVVLEMHTLYGRPDKLRHYAGISGHLSIPEFRHLVCLLGSGELDTLDCFPCAAASVVAA